MLDLMMINDNPIFPEASEIETAEKVMMDFTASASSSAFQSNVSNIELVSRVKIASLKKDIDSKKQQIEAQKQQIKNQQKEIETLKESHASQIRSQQQEIETLKENHASAIRILMENHANDIAKTKTKVWVINIFLILH
jgi:chromosome segregation ATPase